LCGLDFPKYEPESGVGRKVRAFASTPTTKFYSRRSQFSPPPPPSPGRRHGKKPQQLRKSESMCTRSRQRSQ
jgi:hypothetical protein